VLINSGSLVYDGQLAGVNAALADRKVVKLVFSEPVARARLEAYGGLRAREGGSAPAALHVMEATFDVDRSAVRDFSRGVLGELPVADLTIEDVPLEEGIARLYSGGAGAAEAPHG